MSKRSRKISKNQEKPDLIKGLADLSLEEIIALQKTAPILLQSKLQQISTSGDTEALMKANLYMDASSRGDTKMKSVFFDPNDVGDAGREYKETKGILPFETLRRMGDIFIVRSVVNTRVEQVQNFLHFSIDEQKAGYTIRKKRQLFHKEGMSQEVEKADQKKIEYIVNFLENGGLNEKWANFDSFQDFGRKLIFDSLTLDQMAFEITRDRGQDLARFRAIDASLIRLLDSADPKMRASFEKYRYKGYLPRFCMAWQGQILQNPTTKEHVVYYPWELGYGVRNKSTSIYRNGYGTSELETLVQIITWMLWGFEYNGNFFKQGSQPKGFINLKNTNIDTTTLNEFRQAWTQSMRGVGNCLVGSSEIIEKSTGNVSLESFLNGREEREAEVWTGKKFEKGLVYRSQKKKVWSVETESGAITYSSPEHRFRVVSDSGVIEWKERKTLKLGDYLLEGKTSVTGNKILEYKGIQIKEDLCEVLGWMIGDGTFGKDKKEGGNRQISLFFHPEKEREIWSNFYEVLNSYGIHCVKEEKERSEADIKNRQKHGFNSISKTQIKIHIYDTEFYNFLRENDFKPSYQGKEIPKYFEIASPENRRAFLRGLFSADGSKQSGNGNVAAITIVDDRLRKQTRGLLLMEGISCLKSEGKKHKCKFRPVEGIGGETLYIKNNDIFAEKIGFIQSHKQLNQQPWKGIYHNKFSIHPAMASIIAGDIAKELKDRSVKTEQPLSSVYANSFLAELGKCANRKSNFSRQKVEDFARIAGYEIKGEFNDYRFSRIIGLTESEEEVEMFDVEIFSEDHKFLVNNQLTHNSHKTPILQGCELEWIDLQKLSNRDMEFNEWVKFLIIITCSVYRIDPSELGFQFKEQANVFGQDGQKERLEHSKDKGLKPLLVFFQSVVNKYLVEEIDADFEFAFTGIEVEDEAQQVDLDRKKTEAGFVAFEDMFEKYSGRPYDEEKDTILNAQFQSAQQMKQQAEMYAEPMPGEEGVEEDPFAAYKSVDNPILGAGLDYIQQHWGKK